MSPIKIHNDRHRSLIWLVYIYYPSLLLLLLLPYMVTDSGSDDNYDNDNN